MRLRYRTFSLIPLVVCLLISCGPAQEEPEEAVTSSGEPMVAARGDETSDEPRLMGAWKRLSYPYGTIDFRRDSVRFVAGEGLAEEPVFQPYTLAKACPKDHREPGVGTADYFVVVDAFSVCHPIRFRGDTLEIFYNTDADGVDYVRE